MLKHLIYTSSLLTALGLLVGGCAVAADDPANDTPVTVATERSVGENAKIPEDGEEAAVGVITLVNNLGSAQGATAAASNGTDAVRWPSSALKGTYNITTGQLCSTAAAPSGTVLNKTITISGSFASCN